jgi:IS5 family transposase
MPIRMVVTDAATADCTQAPKLLEDLDAGYFLADKVYDRDDIVNQASENGTIPVIPPRKNINIQRYYDKDIYQ